MTSFFLYITFTLFIVISVLLILIVLIQKGRGGGLSSAFGGAGGNTAFGSKTGDVLTWATSVIFGIFLLLAVILNLVSNASSSKTAAAVANPARPIPAQPAPVPAPADAPTAPVRP